MSAPKRPVQQLLAFDFGEKRIGVASANAVSASGNPLRTVAAVPLAQRWVSIQALLAEWQPDALAVGVPRHPDGTAHAMTARCQQFARQLHGRFGLPVFEVDERYSSVEAQARGATDLDAGAACIIAEQFFSESATP